jgi:hypothetical protein
MEHNHSAYLNWLLNGELKFTQLEDAYRVKVIYDVLPMSSAISDSMDIDDELEDREYTWRDSPLWILKDLPIPKFLVPLLVGAKEIGETKQLFDIQTPPLMKRYVSRSGKHFSWCPDLSRGQVSPRAVPCINEVDLEQPTNIKEWIYQNKVVREDTFLENYEKNKLESRRFCSDCGESCGNHDETKRNEDRKFGCVCANLNSAAGFAYTRDRRLRSDWPDAWTIYECGDGCNCDRSTCGNRVVQHGAHLSFLVFKTVSRGWGIRAVRPIKKGEFLVEYCGEMLPNFESDERGTPTFLSPSPRNFDSLTTLFAAILRAFVRHFWKNVYVYSTRTEYGDFQTPLLRDRRRSNRKRIAVLQPSLPAQLLCVYGMF